jgi:predicted HTH transcriptional regulator
MGVDAYMLCRGDGSMQTVSAELQDLVDTPTERLDAEYKSWLNLAENEPRADLARHIAALANHGGGYIVFGIDDQMNYAGPSCYPEIEIGRDLVASIVKKYLEPTLQCDVAIVSSATGNDHPIIIVPPHGIYPICAKSDGPQSAGRVKGIKSGTYYTRKTGPESASVLSPAEWAPII